MLVQGRQMVTTQCKMSLNIENVKEEKKRSSHVTLLKVKFAYHSKAENAVAKP